MIKISVACDTPEIFQACTKLILELQGRFYVSVERNGKRIFGMEASKPKPIRYGESIVETALKLTHASELAPGSKFTSPIITHTQPAIIKPKRKKPSRRTHAKKA